MKIIYTKIATFISLTCLPQLAHGQSNFISGSIITQQGDTLTGLIDYRNWYQNPKKITYKKSNSEPAIIYTTADIKAFSVSNELYERGIVNIEISPYKLEELNDSYNPQFKSDTTFLLNIAPGKKSLYHYRAENDANFFYIKSGTSFELLVHKKYKAANSQTTSSYGGGPTVIKENNLFLNQLSSYLQDCPETNKVLKNTRYTQSSLSKIFSDYYKCTNEKVSATNGNQKKNQLGIIAGPSLATINFKDISFFNKDQFNSNSSAAGLYWNIFLPRSLSLFSSYNEIMYTGIVIKGQGENFLNPENYATSTFSLEYNYLKANTMIRYQKSFGIASIFINTGISNGYAIREKNEIITTTRFYSSEKTTKTKLIPSTSKYEQGFLIGTGASVKKLSGEIRYEITNGFIAANDYSNSVEKYFFLLGFRF